MFTNLTQIQISGLIALLFSTPFLIKSVRNLYLNNASKQWPKVSGIIKEISDFGVKYRLLYEYTVNRETYRNNTIVFTNSNTAVNKRAAEFDKKYALHQIVDVFYNPKNPKQAVLEHGRKDGFLFVIITLSALFVIGSLAVFNQALFLQLMDALFQLFN